MRRSTIRTQLCCTLLGAALLTACGNDGLRGADRTQAVADTAASDLDGMTPEEIEQRAEAISPEEAEQLGVMDTTIHVLSEP